MSDVEEPPTKVTKYEMSQTFTQVEEMEEGQEEWLSEGLLTDDDLNPENSVTDPDRTRSDLDSQGAVEEALEDTAQEGREEILQEETLAESVLQEHSLPEEVLQEQPLQEALQEQMQEQIDQVEELQDQPIGEAAVTMENVTAEVQENGDVDAQETAVKLEDSNIEQALTSMEPEPEPQPDGLDAFLLRAADPPAPAEDSDGNDTDDLLRMLEDDDKSKKVKVKPAHPKPQNKDAAQENQSTDEEDDDEYIFDGATVTKLQVAKNAILTKYPVSKAEPETSEDESSSDDAATMRKMFGGRKPGSKPGPKPQQGGKQVVRIGNANTVSFRQTSDKRPVTSTPLRQYTNTNSKSLLKPAQRSVVKLVNRPPVPVKVERKTQPEHEEIINEEEFLEEDDFDLRDDFGEESDSERGPRAPQQRLMQPERMDEDMLSDPDSHSDDGSLYDELPSSESDDTEEWFTLDVRAERAGDYLPLLGDKAYELLLQEKARMSSRVSSLRGDLRALSAAAAQRAERLRRATAALADVDDMLRAA